MKWRGVVPTLLCGAVLIGACGSNRASSCVEVREAIDSSSFTHVIDPGSVTYQTHPPTSGPHVAVPAPSGVLDSPIPAAVQVRILESGAVIVQHEEVDQSDITELAKLAGPDVVLAPGSDLPAPVVATAWTWKLTCGEPDIEAVTEFIDRRRSAGPGLD